MRRALVPVTVLVLVRATLLAQAAAVACARTRLHAVSASEWRVACEDSSAFVGFDPPSIQSFLLDHNATVRVATPELFLSSTFDRVDALDSPTITQFTLKAEPLWVPTTAVTIDSKAFAKLSALQTLTLQDVPVANTQLHLTLPRSIQKLVIVGCHLQRFSYEITGGGDPKALLEVDLHANNLIEIPLVLYALPSTVINLDVRLNKLATISVSASNKPILEQWMKKGVLQIDNIKNSCPSTATTTRVDGLSQVFEVCVTPNESSTIDSSTNEDTVTTLPSSNASSAAEHGAEASEALGPPPATVHSPTNEAAVIYAPSPSTTSSQPKATVTNTTDQKAKLPTIYAALVALGVVSVMLFSFAFAMAMARRRQDTEPKDDSLSFVGRGKSRSSLLTQVTIDECGGIERRSSDVSNSCLDAGVATSTLPPECSGPNRPGRSISEASAVATPINGGAGRALYTTITTPHSQSQPYMMSRSLQVLTGVSQFSTSSMEKENELRHANKAKLRTILTELAHKRGVVHVNQTPFACFDEVKESEVGALMVRCSAAAVARGEPAHDAPAPTLLLKIYVEQDVRVAIREYRALLVMQSNTCRQFVSQMVATEMEKTLDGLKCAVLVMEMGSATTLRHIVRGQINRTTQFEVVQQLYAVVKALDCLHERQFIHGGVHLDALVVHPSEANQLKFCDLQHATRFGDTIQSSAPLPYGSLEYTPPEMARHLLYCGREAHVADMHTVERDAYRVLRASWAYDTWCLGILILKIYANSKHLDEFDGCATPKDFFLLLADDAFGFERSLALYVHHDDVRDLARACLRRDPRKRPKLTAILSHRVFRAYDRLEQGNLVASFRADRLRTANKTREVSPPTLWFFLPPRALGLTKTRTIDDWMSELTAFQQQQRHENRFHSAELMFPLVFLCEDSHYVSTPCSSTGFHHSKFYLPASLLSLAMPLVQESTLFLEAKSILSVEPPLNVADVSGLGVHQWNELMKFYRALEKMMLAPISSFSLLLLKPLEEMLADQDEQQARQVLDELKCLIFSREKRDHVRSLLDILKTLSINAELDGSSDDDDEMLRQNEENEEKCEHDNRSVVSNDDDDENAGLSTRRATKEWSRLRKCELDGDASVSVPSTRWLCRRHWECEMECEV